MKTKKSKNIEFFYWDISKKDFKNIQKKIPFRRVEFYEKDERVSIRNSFTKGLKQKKIVFKSSNFFLAETRAKRIIFKMLCDRKIIREYDYDNKQKKTGQDTLRYRTLSWYPYDKPYSFDKNKKYMISGYDKDI